MDRRNTHLEPAGGAGEAARLGGGDEVLQGAQLVRGSPLEEADYALTIG